MKDFKCTICEKAATGRCFVCEASDIANTYILNRTNLTDNAFVHALALRLALECEFRYMARIAPEKYDAMRAELERIAGIALTVNVDDFQNMPKA